MLPSFFPLNPNSPSNTKYNPFEVCIKYCHLNTTQINLLRIVSLEATSHMSLYSFKRFCHGKYCGELAKLSFAVTKLFSLCRMFVEVEQIFGSFYGYCSAHSSFQYKFINFVLSTGKPHNIFLLT